MLDRDLAELYGVQTRSDTLLAQSNDSVTIDLGSVVAKKVKLKITSGYENDYWELAEFVVYGEVID